MLTLDVFDLQNNDDFEQVLSFEFPPVDVLNTKAEKIKRKAKLINAATLESITPTHVILHLNINQEVKRIKSRVKAVGSQQIIIGRGYALPIHVIQKVEILSAD